MVVPLIVVALLAAAVVTWLGGEERKTLTAHFPRTISIYEGSDVRVLGVPIGTVDSVTPSGTDVVVTMSYDAEVKVPADAEAVIIAPSIVGDRFVQLTPVYTEGQVLADGATLRRPTAVPLELDQIYPSLDDLTVALGPNGANENGALTDLLEVDRRQLRRPGREVPPDHPGLQQAHRDPGRQQGGALRLRRGLEGFIGTLADNDATVREFNQSLASVSDLLAASARTSPRRCATCPSR